MKLGSHLLLSLGLLLPAAAMRAQGPALVDDLNTTGFATDEANVTLIQAVAGRVLFWASDTTIGFEPWAPGASSSGA